ncbi:MAG: TIGR03905 family TSCPD domain-containing protein [Lachnospiraceae bacterium]|nr:TIGR03905 family TSCPD domain-containing protein [Lachnospiraceae bacterium]
MYRYKTKGTCSSAINFDVEDNKVTSVRFEGGCHGNTQGVAKLVEGRDIDEIIGLLKGIDCHGRGTSCPDQLANALLAYKAQAAG